MLPAGVLPGGDIAARTALTALLIWAVVYDVRFLRIPNILTLAITAVFAAGCAAGLYRPITPHLVCFAAAAVFGAALFFAGLWGGGDAKLLAALALFIEPGTLPLFGLTVALAGGILAAGFLLAGARSSGAVSAQVMPYGVALAAGGFIFIVAAGP